MAIAKLDNGISINYNLVKKNTDSNAKTIVFLNGMYNVMTDWDKTAANLSEKYKMNTLSFDMRSQGGSTAVKEVFEYAEFINDLQLFFDYLELSNMIFITYSCTGIMAMDYIIANPGRVIKLILAAPVINPMNAYITRKLNQAQIKALEHGDLKDLLRIIYYTMFTDSFCEEYIKFYKMLEDQFITGFNKENVLAFSKSWIKHEPSFSKVREVTSSVDSHMFYGEEDVYNPQKYVDELQLQAPDLKIYKPVKAGHGIHLENMISFDQMLENIISQN